MLAAEAPEDFTGAEVDDNEKSTVLGDLFPETAHTEEEEAEVIVHCIRRAASCRPKPRAAAARAKQHTGHHAFLVICGKKDGENRRLR
jgi:hypothetical protein